MEVNMEERVVLEDRLTLPGVLVTPAWLAERLDDADLCILDVRQAELYRLGHIAGANNAPLDSFTCTLDGVPGMLLPPNAYADLMSNLGVSKHTTVVAYDDTWSMAAARLFWSLEHYGHEAVAVLNGGWDLWRTQGLPINSLPPDVVQSVFAAQPGGDRIATHTWLTGHQNHGQDSAEDIVLVDTRTPAEYERGHLPGAVSWDWTNATSPTSWEAVRSTDEVRRELQQLGVTEDKEIVVYCQSGVRAAHTYLVLRHLGYPRVRNYDGSWLEWSARM